MHRSPRVRSGRGRSILFHVFLLLLAGAISILGAAQVQTDSARVDTAPDEATAQDASHEAQEDVASTRQTTSEEDPIEVESPDFSADLDGRQTWTVRYGLGSPFGLAGRGLSAGQLSVDQSLRVDLSAEALSILRVEGQFDPALDDALQSLTVYLDTESLDGILGDFTIPSVSGFSTQRRKTMGIQLEYTFAGLTLTGVAARLEGITEAKTFVGRTAETQITFSGTEPAGSESPYRRHVDGLYAYPLEDRYVEELSDVSLSIPGGAPLRSLLTSFGLGYLTETLAESPASALEPSHFEIIGEDDQVLLLLVEPHDLARRHLEEAIDRYNEENNLAGPDRKSYPFVRDSATERTLLDGLVALGALLVDTRDYALLGAVRETYYDLGRTDILQNSIVVEVSVGGAPLTPITRPELSDYRVEVFAEAGVLEVDFPSSFFSMADSSFRVGFAYRVTGGAYNLGFAVVPDTERVTINGEPIDPSLYEIEYEIGLLILLVDVTETDIIVIEYERFGTGLGGGADYARYLYGLTLDWPISDAFDLTATIQAGLDRAGSVEDPERVRTMPNRQIVGGVLGSISVDDFVGRFSLGYGLDVFPPGESERPPAPNEITAIAGYEGYVFIGSQNGVAVFRNGLWRSYGVSDGLSGRSTRAIVAAKDRVYFGTNAGLTVVVLEGTAPFDRVANWSRYGELDGLANPSIRSLALADNDVWIGTDDGLYAVAVDEMDNPAAWRAYERPSASAITSMVAVDGELVLGTDGDGAYRKDLGTGTLRILDGTEGRSVHDLQATDGRLVVSTDRGVRVYNSWIPSPWIAPDRSIPSARWFDGALYYATEQGLVRASDEERIHSDWPITAIGGEASGGLWAGSRANEAYEMMVWRIAPTAAGYSNETTGLSAQDPGRFLQIPGIDHTEHGVFGRAVFGHDEGILQLDGDVSIMGPGYRAIGQGQQPGAAGWSLVAIVDPLESLSIAASHEYERRLASESPYIRARNEITLSGTFGPAVTVNWIRDGTSTDRLQAGPEATSTSLRFVVGETFFADAVQASLTWQVEDDVDREQGTSRRRNVVSASTTVHATPSLQFDLTFRRPLSATRDETWSGQDLLRLAGEWSPSLAFGSAELDTSVDLRRAIGDSSIDAFVLVEGDLRVSSFELGTWTLSPTFDAGGELDGDIGLIHGQGVLRASGDGLTIRTTLRGELSGLGDSVTRSDAKLSANVSYDGVDGWKPTMTVSTGRSTTTQQGVGTATALDHSLTARSTLSSEPFSNTTSLSLRLRQSSDGRQFTGSFENEYERDVTEVLSNWFQKPPDPAADPDTERSEDPYPTARLRVRANGDARWSPDELDVDASVTGSCHVAWTEMWSASLAGTYLTGTRRTGDWFHSYLLELTVAVDF